MQIHCRDYVTKILESSSISSLTLLELYTILWNGYIAALINCEKALLPLESAINAIYEAIEPYDDKESSYHFTFTKLATVIWNEEVTSLLQERLFDAVDDLLA